MCFSILIETTVVLEVAIRNVKWDNLPDEATRPGPLADGGEKLLSSEAVNRGDEEPHLAKDKTHSGSEQELFDPLDGVMMPLIWQSEQVLHV